MILALLLAAQLAGPDAVVVRVGARADTVPLVRTAAGPALRADLLAVPLGATVEQLANGHFNVVVDDVRFDLADRVPFVRVGADVVPLAGAPWIFDGVLYVPLQLVAEILPRYAAGLVYDTTAAELRRRPVIIAAARPPAASAATPPAPGDAISSRRTTTAAAGKATPRARHKRIVVVDAGHGGPDNGMSGPIGRRKKVREKDVTLAVATRLAAALRARGLEVVMTRTRDTLIALADRGRIANARHADLFISIHVNAANQRWSQPAAARGFETYFLAEAKTEDAKRVEEMENESVRFETGADAPKGDPLAFIINDMAQNEHLRESSDLAAAVQRSLAEIHPGPDRGVKQANFAVLRTSYMPAVLVEIGFGTNAAEMKYITDPPQQRRIASAVAEATLDYLERYEKRVQGIIPVAP